MARALAAAQPPAPLPRQDPGPKAGRASRGPPALLQTSIPPTPRNSPWGDLSHAPTPDPCPGRALAPGPGLAANREATNSVLPKPCHSVFKDVCVQHLNNGQRAPTSMPALC